MHPAFQPRLRRESRPPPLTTLAPFALVVVLCAATQAAIAIPYLNNTHHVRRLADGVISQTGIGDEEFAEAWRRHHVIYWAEVIAAGATLLLMLVWALVAQRNANRLEPGTHRSSWSALGWILPVFNLIVPPRMLARTRTAQLFAYRRKASPRPNYDLIAVWWLLQLAAEGLGAYIAVGRPDRLTEGSVSDMDLVLRLDIAFSIVVVANVVMLIAVVLVVTLTNENLRKGGPAENVAESLATVTRIGPHPSSVSNYPSSIFPVAVHPSDPRWKPTPPPEDTPRDGPRRYQS